MRKLVSAGIMLSPGGMIGPGQHVTGEVIDMAFVAASPDPAHQPPIFRALIRPADQRMVAKLSAFMEPADLLPGTVWGDLMSGEGQQLPQALEALERWWSVNVGTDGYAGSARPVLVAHDAFSVRSRLRDHMPLVEELFSDTIDVTSLRAVTDLSDQDTWEPYQWKSAQDAATDALATFWAIWRRVNEPAQVS